MAYFGFVSTNSQISDPEVASAHTKGDRKHIGLYVLMYVSTTGVSRSMSTCVAMYKVRQRFVWYITLPVSSMRIAHFLLENLDITMRTVVASNSSLCNLVSYKT
jgi:hypothetical protein